MEEVASLAQLNKLEITKLYAETEMVRKYCALTDNGEHKKKERGSKFKTRAAKHNHHSLTYLLRHT